MVKQRNAHSFLFFATIVANGSNFKHLILYALIENTLYEYKSFFQVDPSIQIIDINKCQRIIITFSLFVFMTINLIFRFYLAMFKKKQKPNYFK